MNLVVQIHLPRLPALLGALALLCSPMGCKQDKQTSAPQGATAGPTPTMDVPAKSPPPRRTPPRRRLSVSPKVLPIPADMPALRFNVEKLRATAWYKRSEAAVRKRLLAPSRIAAALQACQVDPINNVEGATVGASPIKGRLGELIVVMKIDRSTATVLTCLTAELGKHKLNAKPLTVAGRKGLAMHHAGRAAAIVALRDNQLMVIVGKLQKRVAAVLEGKAPSIATTTLYNEANAQVGPDSLFGGIFPGLPSGDTAHLPPLLRGFHTGAFLVNVPRGKAALRINLHFEDKEKAKAVTKQLPALLQLAGSQYPGMKDSDTIAPPKARKGWAYVDFKLEDRAFNQILSLLEGLLSPPKAPPKR